MTKHVVIVGNGIAGSEAAREARRVDPNARITVLSEESDRPFSRPGLMYAACGQMAPADLFPFGDAPATRAALTGVDVANRRVLRLDGDPIAYDALVLACGSRPRRPAWSGIDLAGIGHFVSWQDLVWFEAEVHGHGIADAPIPGASDSPYRARPARQGHRPSHPVVIGGGLVGIEAVEVLVAAGLKPTFLLRDDAFWPIALSTRESEVVVERLRHDGVDVHTRVHVEGFAGDGRVEQVRTDGGDIACDFAVVAVGVEPHTRWLADSGLNFAHGGIVVDATMSAAPGVWAAGDAAALPSPSGHRPWPLWYAARDTGRVAGVCAAGGLARWERGVPTNAARLADMDYLTAGEMDGDATWFDEERGPVHSTLRIALRNGRIVGFTSLGRRWHVAAMAHMIQEGWTLGRVLDALPTAAFDTEFVTPYRPTSNAGMRP